MSGPTQARLNGGADAVSPEDHPELRKMGEPLPLSDYLREIWARRDFLLTVPLSELRAQNQNTVLGNAWHLLNPIFLAAVYYLVFGVILDASRGIENYTAFLITGIFTYYFIQKSIMAGSRTIVSNIKLIQSLMFPRAILPISAVITETLAQIPALLALFLLVMFTGVVPSLSWFLVVPILIVQALFNLGAAFITARLTFHFRDVANFLPYILRIWLYMSGILFPATLVPEGLARRIFVVNPAYIFSTLNRRALGAGSTYEGVTTTYMWTLALVWSFAAILMGFFFFRAREAEYGRG